MTASTTADNPKVTHKERFVPAVEKNSEEEVSKKKRRRRRRGNGNSLVSVKFFHQERRAFQNSCETS
jgi:uncharacterized protein YkuJ